MIDLPPDQLDIVKYILKKHIVEYSVHAFGSRINGTAKKHSDLDLVIMSDTPIDPTQMALLKLDFSESNLPIKVDIIDWSTISEGFQKIIKKKSEVIC